jgi:alpha-galactosidase
MEFGTGFCDCYPSFRNIYMHAFFINLFSGIVMVKIAYIGAGSVGFGLDFVKDILTRPALANGNLALMDINQGNLDIISTLAKKIAKQLRVSAKIEPTTNRRRALEDADYVINTVLLHGHEVRAREMEIARKYGVDQAIGCTTGPAGVFRALREIPFELDICHEMEELCPDALLLHYANPTSIVPWAMNVASRIKSIGMCHSVQGTIRDLANYIGAPYEETGHWVAGVNHQAWVLRFEWNGKDAYPLLWEAMKKPEIYKQDMVCFELMRYFGYFLTESSIHNSEYVPYFRKNQELIEQYAPVHGVEHQAEEMAEAEMEQAKMRKLAYSNVPLKIEQSNECCINIINAIETNTTYRFNGNVLNTGLITNLLQGSCVEVPCLVDNMGVHPCYVGDLPPQCAALNRHRSAGDELAVKGALEGDKTAVEQAIALDPLTAAVCTLDQIHDMVEELFKADAPYLPQFK